MSTQHVYPVNDLIDHDTDGDDCVCVPRVEPVQFDDHSLDGRESQETEL